MAEFAGDRFGDDDLFRRRGTGRTARRRDDGRTAVPRDQEDQPVSNFKAWHAPWLTDPGFQNYWTDWQDRPFIGGPLSYSTDWQDIVDWTNYDDAHYGQVQDLWNQYRNRSATPPPPPRPTPQRRGGGGYSLGYSGGGGGGYGGGGVNFGNVHGMSGFSFDPFSFDFRAPTYTAPEAFDYHDFVAPTLEEVQASPGYQFRMEQGRRALENSAAARGLLRSGGTLKDILDYGQSFADTTYQTNYDRQFREWDANRALAADEWAKNYQTGLDTYQIAYGQEMDRFNRALQSWQGNLGLASTTFDNDFRAAQAQQAAMQAAQGMALQQQAMLNSQRANQFGNLMDIYRASTSSLPTGPGQLPAYTTGFQQGVTPTDVTNSIYGGSTSGVLPTAPIQSVQARQRQPGQTTGRVQNSVYQDPYAGYYGV